MSYKILDYNETKKGGNKFDLGMPLCQQDFDLAKLKKYLTNKMGLSLQETKTGTGFLTICPNCQEKKLFYNYKGKMFLCLDYDNCGVKFVNVFKLKKFLARKN